MPIVDGGRRLDALEAKTVTQTKIKVPTISMQLGQRNGAQLHVVISGRQDMAQVLPDMNTVQDFFGLNRPESTRLALHIVAEAIRAGRFNV